MGTMAQVLARALNRYEGDDPWGDVVWAEEGWVVDREATDKADPSGMSEEIVLIDGSRVIWDETAERWIAL